MSKHLIQFEVDHNDTQLRLLMDKSTSAPDEFIHEFMNVIAGMAQKAYNGHINAKLGCAYASVSGTFTGAPSATETITIGGTVFTARASGATGDEFNIGGSVTLTAAALVAAINASTTNGISSSITASNVAGVITLRANTPGKIGNLITVSETLSNFTFAGSATRLASGANATDKNYLFGRAKETT